MPEFTVVKDESSRQRWLVVNSLGVITGSARTKKAAQEIADNAHALAESIAPKPEYPRWPY